MSGPAGDESSGRTSFGARLATAFDRYGQLCVGIDPHPFLLDDWGLPTSAEGVRSFGLTVIEQSAGSVGIVKPQVAFYERYGSRGFAALEDVLQAARDADLVVIGDAKRGDIGTTMDSYGDAWFADGSPLRVDALTCAAYQGLGANAGFLRRARESGRGVFVLAATSNPEARLTQTARLSSGRSVAAGIVDDVLNDNSASDQGDSRLSPPARRFGDAGLVLGATLDLADYGIALDRLVSTPILAPGFGAQGARYGDVKSLFGPAAASVLVSASRSILASGPTGVRESARRASDEVAACLA